MVRIISFFLACGYAAIIKIRNLVFQYKIISSYQSKIYTICVGNLSAGGTGKTPFIEYLISFLKQKYTIVIVSRGYKRKTKGLQIADNESSPESIGDEPYQIWKKFEEKIPVIVCANRKFAFKYIEKNSPNTNLILMDDGFQHRTVTPHLSLILTPFSSPFFTDFYLPLGRLRESRAEILRAKGLIFTKTPPNFEPYPVEKLPKIPHWYFEMTYLEYQNLENQKISKPSQNTPIILVTGIVQSEFLVEKIENEFKIVYHFEKSDHYKYKSNDWDRIYKKWRSLSAKFIITTEKDSEKLKKIIPSDFHKFVLFLPIETRPTKNDSSFEGWLLRQIQSKV